MNKQNRIAIAASLLIFISYIPGIYPSGLLSGIISCIPFMAGILLYLRNQDLLWLIITGEILVINNNSIISSLAVQLILAALFILTYIDGEKSTMYSAITGCFIVTALFAYLASGMQIAAYAFLCIAASLTGYLIVEIRWRIIRKKVTEG